MCLHEFYRSNACGHQFPKLPPSAKRNTFFENYYPTIAVPRSFTCRPVKLALKFYHDQVVYRPADMTCPTNVEMPKTCPIIHHPCEGVSRRYHKQRKADKFLQKIMLDNGIGEYQLRQAEIDASVLDQCSNRAKPGQHNPAELQKHKNQAYPQNMYAHVQSVKRYQARDKRDMVPNVIYTEVDFGCGGPFSAECLTGWTGIGLLTHRLHLWGDTVTHVKPCSDECLAGWSGYDLDVYREETWRGHDPKIWKSKALPNWKTWKKDVYPWLSDNHVSKNTDNWAIIDYSNISHLHDDQFDLIKGKFVRVRFRIDPRSNTQQCVHVPDQVCVPIPELLNQVLRRMNPIAQPKSPLSASNDQASIEDLLDRLPQAFAEQGPLLGGSSQPAADYMDDFATKEEGLTSKSDSPGPVAGEGCDSDTTVVDGSEEGSAQEKDLTRVETPEEAEARRQRAIKEMREKIARDFPGGQEKVVVVDEEG